MKYAKENHVHPYLASFLGVLLFFSLGIILWEDSMINKLEYKISLMPNYECFNQTTERWTTLSARVCWKATTKDIEEGNVYFSGNACSYINASEHYNVKTDKIKCEKEFIALKHLGTFRNVAFENNNCIIETTKKVCKLDGFVISGAGE